MKLFLVWQPSNVFISVLAEESDESASQPTRCDSPGKGEPDTTSGGGENPNSERSDPDKVQDM